MIEIKTQAEFDNLATTIVNTPSTGELIRIFPLADDIPYILTTALNIRRSNVIIKGVGKPKIKLNTTETTSPNGNIINIMGWSGTATAGGATTITLAVADAGTDSLYVGYEIAIISGTGKGQVRKISSYVASTRVATVPTWTANPSTDSVYSIFLTNVSIKNLQLTGGRYDVGGAKGYYGIYVFACGYAQTAGLTTGTYSRYDSSTNGNTKLNRVGVKIDNCVVQNNINDGINLEFSSNNTVSSNTVQNNGSNGIYLTSSGSNNTVTSNTVQNNASYGISVSTPSNNIVSSNIIQNNASYGINLYYSNNTTVISNTIQNNNYGIYIYSSRNNTVTSNTVQNNANHGIYIYSSRNNTVTSNTAQNNDYGIYIFSSSNNTVTSNVVQNSRYKGIYLDSASNNTVSSNTIQNNMSDGIYLVASVKNCVCNNQSNSNAMYGIRLYSTANNYNNIYSNVALSNTSGQYISDGGTDNIATSAVNSW